MHTVAVTHTQTDLYYTHARSTFFSVAKAVKNPVKRSATNINGTVDRNDVMSRAREKTNPRQQHRSCGNEDNGLIGYTQAHLKLHAQQKIHTVTKHTSNALVAPIYTRPNVLLRIIMYTFL